MHTRHVNQAFCTLYYWLFLRSISIICILYFMKPGSKILKGLKLDTFVRIIIHRSHDLRYWLYYVSTLTWEDSVSTKGNYWLNKVIYRVQLISWIRRDQWLEHRSINNALLPRQKCCESTLSKKCAVTEWFIRD